jgi:hypothetical protein
VSGKVKSGYPIKHLKFEMITYEGSAGNGLEALTLSEWQKYYDSDPDGTNPYILNSIFESGDVTEKEVSLLLYFNRDIISGKYYRLYYTVEDVKGNKETESLKIQR